MLHELWGEIRHPALTFTLHDAGHSVDRGDGPGQTKPLFLQLALLPSGALLNDFDHGILLQELSVKCADPEKGRTTPLDHKPK